MYNIKKITSSIVLVAIMAACSSRDTDKELIGRKGNYLKINLSVQESKQSISSSVASSKTLSLSDDKIISSQNGVDFLVNSQTIYIPHNNNNVADINKAGLNFPNAIAVSKPINSGNTYQIVVYRESDIGLQDPIIIDQNTNVNDVKDLVNGDKYKWYAYSFNDNQPLPDFSTDVTIKKADIAGKDFLYAEGSFTAQPGENSLNISFKHKTVIIELFIDSQGLSGPIEEDSPLISLKNGASSRILQIGDFNLLDGKYNDLSDLQAPFQHKDSILDHSNGKYYRKIYKIRGIVNEPIHISKDSLNTQLNMNIYRKDPGTTVSETLPVPANISLSNNELIIDNGGIYKFGLSALESGVKVNGVTWARTNYAGTSSLWRLSVNNLTDNSNTGIYSWPYMTYLDGSFPDPNNVAKRDVCQMLYPHIWRLPTQQEFIGLFDSSNSRNAIGKPATNATSNDGIYGIEFELDSGESIKPNFPEYSRKLLLQASGYHDNTVFPYPIYRSGYRHISGSEQVRGYFWTRESNTNVGLFTVNVSINVSNVASIPSPAYLSTTSLAEIIGPGRNDYRYSVRCVRK